MSEQTTLTEIKLMITCFDGHLEKIEQLLEKKESNTLIDRLQKQLELELILYKIDPSPAAMQEILVLRRKIYEELPEYYR